MYVCLAIDVNECASQPCHHNASCHDNINGFKCSCAAGYTGVLCETGKSSTAHHQKFISLLLAISLVHDSYICDITGSELAASFCMRVQLVCRGDVVVLFMHSGVFHLHQL